MRVSKLFFFFSCWLCAGLCTGIAQSNYLPGYYVNINSDTVQGYVEVRSIARMYRTMRFKQLITSRPIQLRPDNAKGVAIANRNFYETHSSTGTKGKVYRGFFKLLVFGRMKLFLFEGKYFVQKAGGELFEITKKDNVRSDNKIETDYRGYGILKTLMADCDKIDEQFLSQQYDSQPNYKHIVMTYNGCFQENYVALEDAELPAHVDFGIQGFGNTTSFDFAQSNSLSNAEFGSRITGGGGVFFSFFIPKLGDNLRLVTEPSFGMYNGYSFFVDDSFVTNDLFLRYSYVKIPIIMRYFFTRNLFFDIGISNLLPIKQNLSWRKEFLNSSGIVMTDNGPSYFIQNRLLGAVAGVGGKINLGSMPLYPSIRFSHLPAAKRSKDQPVIQMIEFSVALQLKRE